MRYNFTAIADDQIPRACEPFLQHVLDTYASETNKVVSVWSSFAGQDLSFRPHDRSSSIEEILKHQLLSERRFFGEFLGTPEPAPVEILPPELSVESYCDRLVQLARPRLGFFSQQPMAWWQGHVPFFDVERERIWVFWRRVLHTAHHRTQLTVFQRLMELTVLPTYGPTADVSWEGADPTHTVEAAGRGAAPVQSDDH